MQKYLVGSGIALFLALALVGTPFLAQADHSWGGYHWARTSNPFVLKLGDNVSGVWDSHLNIASVDWSASSVLDTIVVTGQSNPKNCRPVAGRIEVCNSKYGNNGWLGIASIWATGGHITQGTAKLNDTYFNTPTYNTAAWRQLVVCQEIAHAFGLDHQDENFTNPNLGTCMDYTNNPSTNQHPDDHDFAQLELIYEHLDSVTTVSQALKGASGATPANVEVGDNASEWGRAIRSDNSGNPSLFVKEIGGDKKVFTFVIWADGEHVHE